jgi:hypothetical protein
MPGHSPDRPPCCCEERCTCPHCHSGPARGPPRQHNRSPSSRDGGHLHSHRHHHSIGGVDGRREEKEAYRRSGLCSARRCTSCIPEQAELSAAELLGRQQRCDEARVTEQLRRMTLAKSFGHQRGGHRGCYHHPFYTTNTAELLRRQNNVPYHAAVDAEYDARRRELQAELDARRGEIAAMQRAREDRRMEAAFCESEAARCRASCGPRRGSFRRSRSTDHVRPSSPPRPQTHPSDVPPRLPQEPSTAAECPPPPPPPNEAAAAAPPSPPFDQRHRQSCGDRTPPPLRHRPHHGEGWERGSQDPCGHDGGHRPPSPHGPAGHGWGCCPPAPPSPHGPCGRRAPSPWQHSKRLPPPPPGVCCHHPHHHHHPPPPRRGCDGGCVCHDDDCQRPSPCDRQPCQARCLSGGLASSPCTHHPPQTQQPRVCSPHHSPKPTVAAANTCPSCGHPLMNARDVVSMIAAGRLESSVACPSCGFVGGLLRCPAHHRAPSPCGRVSDDDKGCREGRGHARRGQPCGRGPRSRSAGSSSSSYALLSNPKFGRKVFITDDLYRDRRARYLAEWEARGAVQRMPPSHRSPSAALPERTPKWRTTGGGCFAD